MSSNKQISFGGGGGGEQRQQQQQQYDHGNHAQQQYDHGNHAQQQHLGPNKMGKNNRKRAIHQTNYQMDPNSNDNNKRQQYQHHQNQQQQSPQPQPQVYNINKNDFRSIVQQLTGTPTRDPTPNPTPDPSPAPATLRPATTPRSSSMRLQRIRPPPLAPIARPTLPIPAANPNSNLGFYPRAPPPQVPSPMSQPRPLWANAADSPVSVYMRYLESSILNPDGPKQAQLPPPQARPPQAHLPMPGGRQPLPPPGPFPAPAPLQQAPRPPQAEPIQFPSPAATGPSLPSPSAFLNLHSPRSPHPSLSPRFQFPPPISPTFMLSPLSQSGGWLGSFPQSLASPGSLLPPSPLFPTSPSKFLLSPRWRDM